MKILIETIPHEKQRYPTVGDWQYLPDPNGGAGQILRIRVSDMGNDEYAALVAIHELVEVLLCKKAGVTQEAVDKYDMEFEKVREERIAEAARGVSEPGVTSGEEALIAIEEPGDQRDAPYRREHCMATGVERIVAAALDIPWADYEKVIEDFP